MVKLKAFEQMEVCFKWFDNGWEDWVVVEYCLKGIVQRFVCCDKTSFDDKVIKLILRKQSIYNHYEKCLTEKAVMTNHKIEGTSITYYDFLKKSMDVMTSYVTYPQVIKEFKNKAYKPYYPLYHKWLRIKYDEATAYRQATEQGDISGLKQFFQKLITNEYDRRVGKENLYFVIELLAKYEAETNKSIFNEQELLCAFQESIIPGKVHVKFDHYKKCQAELTAMKTDKRGEDSVLDLVLKKPIDVLTYHVVSGQFEIKDKDEKALEKKLYPIYSEWFDL